MGNTQNKNTKKSNLRKFKIRINEQYKLQVSYIDSEKQETIIQLNNNKQDWYSPIVSFRDNKITVCSEEKEDAIHFIEEFFTNPQSFKLYPIHFQGKNYEIIAEVLFALIINEFKQIVDWQFYHCFCYDEFFLNNLFEFIDY